MAPSKRERRQGDEEGNERSRPGRVAKRDMNLPRVYVTVTDLLIRDVARRTLSLGESVRELESVANLQ